jgi:competence protein ComEC
MGAWKQFPLSRILVFFIAGIFLGLNYSVGKVFLLALLSVLLFLFLVLVTASKKIVPFSLRWIPGVFIILISFIITLTYSGLCFSYLKNDPLHDVRFEKQMLIADIICPVTQKARTTKVIVKVIATFRDRKFSSISKNMLVYLEKDSGTMKLDYGDRLLLYAAPKEPPEPLTPYSFNYKRFLGYRGIFIQSYVKSSGWKLIGKNRQNPLIASALTIRNRLLEIFRRNGITGREFAVGGALLLGYTDEIDPGLMKDYSATGAMHILSVSGMHVGMIFLVLEKLLMFLRKMKYGIPVKTVLIIVFVWFYALITGLSPCVLRAAAMLSLVAIGNSLVKPVDIVNTLMASLLLLLFWKPLYLMDTGFQLSYMAIGGIILIYKPLSNIYNPGNWLANQIWGILAVSIAAQIATFPLSLYYFHQFPNYFMLTNIIVIPLSSLVIYTGILLLFLESVPFISIVVAKAFIVFIWSLNTAIHFIEELPLSTFRGVFITIPQMILLYAVFASAGMLIFTKRKLWLAMVFLILIVFAGTSVISKIERLGRHRMVIYRFRESSAIEFIQQGRSILMGNRIFLLTDYSNDNLQNMRNVLAYHEKLKLLVNPLVENMKSFTDDQFFRKGNFIQFYGKRIAIINREIKGRFERKICVDILLVTGNPRLKIADLLNAYSFNEIIIDGSTPQWKIQKWIAEAKQIKIRGYSVDQSGIIIRDF